MTKQYHGTTPIFDDSNWRDLFQRNVGGERKGLGLVPRDYSEYPEEMYDPPSDLQLIPRGEWDARIEEIERTESGLKHIRLRMVGGQPMPSLDQDGDPYCWGYSTGSCMMLTRGLMNQPYVRLNPHSVCAIIKGGRGEGGWCGLSAKFLRESGIAVEGTGPGQWPRLSRSLSNDNAATRSGMALHKSTEEWVDLTRSVYDQNLTFDQVATCLLLRIPCALDFNWWSHSVCGLELVRVEAGSYGILILNSWTDSWEDRGMGILRGSKAIPDGALAIRTSTPSVA